MLGGGLSLKKKKCKSLRNFICGTLCLRIGFYLDAFVKVGVRSFLSIFRFSIQHLYMSVADTSVDFI